jgi:hypothetical protein
MHDTEGETIEDVRRQRDAALARAEKAEADLRKADADRAAAWDDARAALARAEKAEAELKWVNGERTTLLCLCNEMSPDDAPDVVSREMAYDAVDQMQDRLYAAVGARDELGIQLASLRERLRLAMVVVDEARKTANENWRVIDVAILAIKLAALDAVPGDKLERP